MSDQTPHPTSSQGPSLASVIVPVVTLVIGFAAGVFVADSDWFGLAVPAHHYEGDPNAAPTSESERDAGVAPDSTEAVSTPEAAGEDAEPE